MSLADRMKIFGGNPESSDLAAPLPARATSGAQRRSWGAPTASAHDIIAKVAANDAGTQIVDLSNSAIFQMKSDELMAQLSSALAANTHVVDLILVNCNIGQNGCASLRQAVRLALRRPIELASNAVLKSINLEKNCVNQEGATALAQGLAKNTGIKTVDLMNQKNCRWGDQCLDAFLEMFQTNITLVKINWRLESRKSFALNKMITRNNEIDRRKKCGMSYNSILPAGLQDPNAPLSPTSSAAPPAPERHGKENDISVKAEGLLSHASAEAPPLKTLLSAPPAAAAEHRAPPDSAGLPQSSPGTGKVGGASIASRWQQSSSGSSKTVLQAREASQQHSSSGSTPGGGATGGEIFVRPKRSANSVLNRWPPGGTVDS